MVSVISVDAIKATFGGLNRAGIVLNDDDDDDAHGKVNYFQVIQNSGWFDCLFQDRNKKTHPIF